MAGGLTSIAGAAVGRITFVLLVGYITPESFLYLGITTGLLWLNAPLTSAFTRKEVGTLFPEFLDLWFVYPTAIYGAFWETTGQHGILGGIFVIIFGIILIRPYLIGIDIGLTTWPELLLLRIIA